MTRRPPAGPRRATRSGSCTRPRGSATAGCRASARSACSRRDAGACASASPSRLEPVAHAKATVARALLLAGALGMAGALLGGLLIAASLAAPLRRMARVAARVDAGDLSHRMELSGPHDEVRALAHSFDQMLDRLQDAFARQTAFVADASHELRTPADDRARAARGARHEPAPGRGGGPPRRGRRAPGDRPHEPAGRGPAAAHPRRGRGPAAPRAGRPVGVPRRHHGRTAARPPTAASSWDRHPPW